MWGVYYTFIKRNGRPLPQTRPCTNKTNVQNWSWTSFGWIHGFHILFSASHKCWTIEGNCYVAANPIHTISLGSRALGHHNILAVAIESITAISNRTFTLQNFHCLCFSVVLVHNSKHTFCSMPSKKLTNIGDPPFLHGHMVPGRFYAKDQFQSRLKLALLSRKSSWEQAIARIYLKMGMQKLKETETNYPITFT